MQNETIAPVSILASRSSKIPSAPNVNTCVLQEIALDFKSLGIQDSILALLNLFTDPIELKIVFYRVDSPLLDWNFMNGTYNTFRHLRTSIYVNNQHLQIYF